MAHGYMREYDEDFDRGEERERSWRGSNREDRDWRDRDRGGDFMLRDEANRRWRQDTGWGEGDDWPQRSSNYARFGGELGGSRSRGDYSGARDDRFGGSSSWNEAGGTFSNHPDDHYRSWRKKQIDALDRDYADYCREREEQFHRDFDAWRGRRHGNPQPLQAGMTQTGLSSDPTGELQLTTEAQSPAEGGQDPTATATLGTNSSGRGTR
jgi:hypothetical protein